MHILGNWIQPGVPMGSICPVFRRNWSSQTPLRRAMLYLTALGTYEAVLNGNRVSDEVLAPGWTAYEKRLQVQCYDITHLIRPENCLEVTVGRGWFRSRLPGQVAHEDVERRHQQPCGILGWLVLTDEHNTTELIPTDTQWQWSESPIRYSELYGGETYDATFTPEQWSPVVPLNWKTDILIPQEGEPITQQERIAAKSVFTTPAGETIVDFGQEVTGYVEFSLHAHPGDRVRIRHGEVLDKDGNFYNANYRDAKSEILYICRDGWQIWHPRLTFFGFRYLKLAEFPREANPEQFTAIVVGSQLKRTGYLRCSDPDLNKLFSNINWSLKGNFLDVPTDCPQRDERLGWTGDAQVFVKAASYQYDVERFFRKWLRDLSAQQRRDGAVAHVVPDVLPYILPSAAWGDAATIVPWQIYLTYGDSAVLSQQFDSMCAWVDYITGATTTPGLWTGGRHYGDWLALDAPEGSCRGKSREDLIATCFYARSTELVIKTGRVLGRNVSSYEALYAQILVTFRKTYPEYLTQTECVLAAHFRLSPDPQKTADQLAELVIANGRALRTGFVGTPYLLHVLSDYGHTELAYDLLLRKEYPGWLYAVGKGATTIWEHWDGIREDCSFWSEDMNSFNHYAYGAVADWVYEQAAGIQLPEDAPGFSSVRIAPQPDYRLNWLEAILDTRHGRISSQWVIEDDAVRYTIETPVSATIVIGNVTHKVRPGRHIYWQKRT